MNTPHATTDYQPLLRADVPDPGRMQRTPRRPLGQFSDFVVQELPSALTAVHDRSMEGTTLTQKLDALAREAVQRSFTNQASPDDKQLAHLDAAIAEQTVIALGAKPSLHTLQLTEHTAQAYSSVPALTYGSLIRMNPLESDPRTFHVGEIGRSELLFYRTHLNIERIAADCTSVMRSLLDEKRVMEEDDGATCHTHFSIVLPPYISALRTAFDALFSELPVEHLQAVRPFFTSNAERALPGPSGKFSAGLFAIDAHTLGDTEEMKPFLEGKMREIDLFPHTSVETHRFAGQTTMREAFAAAGKGSTLHQLAKNSQSHAVKTSFLAMIQQIYAMRKAHFRLVGKFVPEALAGKVMGTGGEQNVRQYLATPLKAYEACLNRFSSFSPQRTPSPLTIFEVM